MLKNCSECGKLFTATVTLNICLECKRKEEEEYDKVYKFVKKNKGASLIEVEKATGVDRKKIIKFIKEGRISQTEIISDEKLVCSSCGKEIIDGKFCKNCAEELKKKIDMLIDALKESSGGDEKEKEIKSGKMHTLEFVKRKKGIKSDE